MIEYFPTEKSPLASKGKAVSEDIREEEDCYIFDEDKVGEQEEESLNVDNLEDFFLEFEDKDIRNITEIGETVTPLNSMTRQEVCIEVDISKILNLPSLPMITYHPDRISNDLSEEDDQIYSSEDDLITDGETDQESDSEEGIESENKNTRKRLVGAAEKKRITTEVNTDFENIGASLDADCRTQEEYDSDDEYDRLHFGYQADEEDNEERDPDDETNVENDVAEKPVNVDEIATKPKQDDSSFVNDKLLLFEDCFIRLRRIQKEILRPLTVDLIKIKIPRLREKDDDRNSQERMMMEDYGSENNEPGEDFDKEFEELHENSDGHEDIHDQETGESSNDEADDFDELIRQEISEFESMEVDEDIDEFDTSEILEAVEPWTEYVEQTSVTESTHLQADNSEEEYFSDTDSDMDCEIDSDIEGDIVKEMEQFQYSDLRWDDVKITSQPENESLLR